MPQKKKSIGFPQALLMSFYETAQELHCSLWILHTRSIKQDREWKAGRKWGKMDLQAQYAFFHSIGDHIRLYYRKGLHSVVVFTDLAPIGQKFIEFLQHHFSFCFRDRETIPLQVKLVPKVIDSLTAIRQICLQTALPHGLDQLLENEVNFLQQRINTLIVHQKSDTDIPHIAIGGEEIEILLGHWTQIRFRIHHSYVLLNESWLLAPTPPPVFDRIRQRIHQYAIPVKIMRNSIRSPSSPSLYGDLILIWW